LGLAFAAAEMARQVVDQFVSRDLRLDDANVDAPGVAAGAGDPDVALGIQICDTGGVDRGQHKGGA
jgi:hypothetical protein